MGNSKTWKTIGQAALMLPAVCISAALPLLAQSSAPPARPTRLEDPNKYYRGPSSATGKTILIPIGSTWEGRIDQTISSARSRTGQTFKIVISSPVLMNGTEVLVPAGSQILGEVVEAVPAGNVPVQKGENKRYVHGKLRVALSGLRLPDGTAYPLVASLTGEVPSNRRFGQSGSMQPLGTSVGYVGTAAQFESVNPSLGRSRNGKQGGGHVVTRQELFADPLLGINNDPRQKGKIRSLVLKGRDYWVYEGSPLTIRLEAPFKIGMASPDLGGVIQPLPESPPRALSLPAQEPADTTDGNTYGGADNGGPAAGSGAQSIKNPDPGASTNGASRGFNSGTSPNDSF